MKRSEKASLNRIMDSIMLEEPRTAISRYLRNFSFSQGDKSNEEPYGLNASSISINEIIKNQEEAIDFNEYSISSCWGEDRDNGSSEAEYDENIGLLQGESSAEKQLGGGAPGRMPLRDMGNRLGENSGGRPAEKEFACTHKSCPQSYTSSYGLRYHLKHGHTTAKRVEKRPYACSVPGCFKSYKNTNGLKYHKAHAHPELPENAQNTKGKM